MIICKWGEKYANDSTQDLVAKVADKVKNEKRLCYLTTTATHDNHSSTDTKLGSVNLSTPHPQAICRKTPITQSFKVSNWGPSVWICYCQFWFWDEDNMLGCSLLLTLQGIRDVNRMDAQPLVQRPPTEPACPRVIILILLHWLITMLAVIFLYLTTGLRCLMWEQPFGGSVKATAYHPIYC